MSKVKTFSVHVKQVDTHAGYIDHPFAQGNQDPLSQVDTRVQL